MSTQNQIKKQLMEHTTKSGKKGFTLIELLIVITIIGILISIAVPQYRTSVKKSREAVLKENLFLLRKTIHEYYIDKKKYPTSLEDLVKEGYLREIPIDPITKSRTTWIVIREEPEEGQEYLYEEELGIIDVKSGAKGKSLDGTPYSEF